MIYLCRVGDGINFNNSKNIKIWGFNKCYKNKISNINNNDKLIFIKNGGIVLGIACFESYKDKNDEPLINIDTETNNILNWINNENYPIQIKYKNFIDLHNLKIENLKCRSSLINFNKKYKFIMNNINSYEIEIDNIIKILYES